MGPTNVKRIQGRPIRGEGDVGRDKLIEAARTILRTRISPDISRKAVAEAAGVTPALVSYYFPDKNSLLAAAVNPSIGQRLDCLHAILESKVGVPAKLREIVVLFIGFNAEEAQLFDYYIDLCKDRNSGVAQKQRLLVLRQRMLMFYMDGVEAGAWRRLDPDLFLLALWGACKLVAQASAFRLDEAPEARPLPATVDMVVDLVLNGITQHT